jgi:hypothetical protein
MVGEEMHVTTTGLDEHQGRRVTKTKSILPKQTAATVSQQEQRRRGTPRAMAGIMERTFLTAIVCGEQKIILMAQGVAENQLKECEEYASQVTRVALKLARRGR